VVGVDEELPLVREREVRALVCDLRWLQVKPFIVTERLRCLNFGK
jgi:hypothetical protein